MSADASRPLLVGWVGFPMDGIVNRASDAAACLEREDDHGYEAPSAV